MIIKDFETWLASLRKRVEILERTGTRLKNIIAATDGVFRPPVMTSDPSSPTEGDIWYRSDLHTWRGRKNGSTVTFTTA